METITRVTVPSKWGGLYDTAKTANAEFRLGDGPCGKTVTKLFVRWDGDPDRFTVRQHYEDNTWKDFIYLASDLTGRVKISYR